MTARPIRRNAQTPDRNGKIFYTSTTSLSHISRSNRYVTESSLRFLKLKPQAVCLWGKRNCVKHKRTEGGFDLVVQLSAFGKALLRIRISNAS